MVREHLITLNEPPGPDELHPSIPKEMAYNILEVLSAIVDNSCQVSRTKGFFF